MSETGSYKYDAAFFDHATQGSLASARKVSEAVRRIMPVASVVDVGCAQGVWLSVWRDGGAEVTGVDGDYVDRARMLIDPARFVPHDLTASFSLGRRFDLAQSLEVAEHLPASRAAGFVDDLTRHADAVLFSAAPPGQGGEHHINEQPYEYWRDLFAARGYALYDCLRPLVRDDPAVSPWYRHNLFLYLKESVAAGVPDYVRLFRVPGRPHRGRVAAHLPGPQGGGEALGGGREGDGGAPDFASRRTGTRDRRVSLHPRSPRSRAFPPPLPPTRGATRCTEVAAPMVFRAKRRRWPVRRGALHPLSPRVRPTLPR